MRRTVIALGWLLCPASLFAAPVPAGHPAVAAPVSEADVQSAAREYRQNLSQVFDYVERLYVRPVNRADLAVSALTGLYEAAQVPVPAGLKAEVKKAEGAALDALLVKARANLGNPDALRGQRALIASCRAVMRSLDPFCAVVTGEEAATATGFDQNFGLGIDLVDKSGTGPVVIKAVVPGGPAQRAGLQAGDHITRVDDKETGGLSTEQALRLLNGGSTEVASNMPPPPPGVGRVVIGDPESLVPTPVRLTVRSAGAKEARKVTVLRDRFEPETVQGVTRAEDNSWDYWVDRKKGIAQVRIVALARHTDGELERVLSRLDGVGLRGLILDLRWCPGGYLSAATGAAELFLEDGVIAKTVVRNQGPRADAEQVFQAGAGEREKFLRFPIVVLVNADTSGGGELIAAALQDHQRGVVVGQRTRGKGSIQTPTLVPLVNEAGQITGTLGLKLTNGTFLRPNGKGLSRFADSKTSDDWGVKPEANLEFRVSADLGRRLKGWWQEQSLRPGASNKALPLDDPEQDPQRQAALKALLRLVAEKK
ncbi:MAG TPA: S41 family peptidase [Gemmataceae bacterium]|nr:S41 family peptidase [Gemmataceae bacterium]